MANTQAFRTKIASVQSTKKITRAMELVAASKLRRTQDRMALSRPYATKIRQVIGHIANSQSEYRHPALTKRDEVKRVGYIIISTDAGLCGGLNLNLFKKCVSDMQTWADKGVPTDLGLVGRKGMAFFSKHGAPVLAHVEQLGDKPEVADLAGVVKVMLDAFYDGKIDQVNIAYNEFVNTMVQKPTIKQLLPLECDEDETMQNTHWDYIYEPEAKPILDQLLSRYLESQVYQAVVENIACEQAAKMVAMKNASDNAEDIIDQLKLAYNKVRQAAITQEIAEIVAGADAV